MSEHPATTSPTVVSLLICDQVIDDKLTNKKSAIGLFNMVVVPQVPVAINQMAILASVTEIVGKVQLELRLVNDRDDSVIFASKGFVAAPSPLAVVDLVFTMQGIRVPTAGQYAFEMLHQGSPLARRRFQVLVRPPPQAPPQTPPQAPPQAPPPAESPHD